MKYAVALAILLFTAVGCETTGNKRVNGANSEHVAAKLKNVTIYGDLSIGGADQKSADASQEGLGKIKANADGNTVDGGL